MMLGHVEGKVTTNEFTFLAKEEVKNFEYVQVYHKVYEYVLCQVTEVTNNQGRTSAHCNVIGYSDQGKTKRPRIPFDPGTEVLRAEDDFIKKIISLPQSGSGAYIGHLEGRSIPVHLDLNTVLTKHVAVLAKSGAGKSYAVGVLVEEILEKGVPLVIIDPHGEHSSLSQPSTDDEEQLALFGVTPTKYVIAEYADTQLVTSAKPLRLPAHLSGVELSHLLPGKLSANQQAVLYSALKHKQEVTFDSLLYELESEESPAKYGLISTLEYLRGLPFFSAAPTPYHELVKPSCATIINLKGIPPDVQEIIVYKLCKDLFLLRKQNKISPFFLVVEEAHNYCPERSFGETKASKVLRDIASEGRKFGLGLCVVSQRPARVDKSVLSQCSTQLILKVTNPNDLRALSASVEGLTGESEQEIRHLPIGTALVTGISDLPLFVSIRPRRTAHGGGAVNIIGGEGVVSAGEQVAGQGDVFGAVKEFEEQALLPLIKPVITAQDLRIMSDEPLLDVRTVLLPAYQFACKEGEEHYNLLVEMREGGIVVDKENMETKHLPRLERLSAQELLLLKTAYSQKGVSTEQASTLIGGLSADQEIASLVSQGYLCVEGDVLKVTGQHVYTRLNNLAHNDVIAYETCVYDEKHSPNVSLEQVREMLNKYTTIIDQHECFIVNYKPIKREKIT